jgi:hypothetical protein
MSWLTKVNKYNKPFISHNFKYVDTMRLAPHPGLHPGALSRRYLCQDCGIRARLTKMNGDRSYSELISSHEFKNGYFDESLCQDIQKAP